MSVLQVIQTVSIIVSMLGVLFAVRTYYRNSRIREAEWLKSLYEKFYENAMLKDVRNWIEDDLVVQKIAEDPANEDKVSDYLNFFEFVATLWRLKQLSYQEILMLFEYYLRMLNKNPLLKGYIHRYGFENLAAMLAKLESTSSQQ